MSHYSLNVHLCVKLLQNQEPSHPVRHAELPPHLADGPFLVPVTTSIWHPIKICRLCFDFYDKFDLFDHNTRITRSTIIRPSGPPADFLQTKYVEDVDELSTKGGTQILPSDERKPAASLEKKSSPNPVIERFENDTTKVKLNFESNQQTEDTVP